MPEGKESRFRVIVISKPGAAIKVEKIILSEELKRALTCKATGLTKRRKKTFWEWLKKQVLE